MKNNNKFLVTSANRVVMSYLLSAVTKFMSFNVCAVLISVLRANTNRQITNEESVFDTNSTNDIVIEGRRFERFYYLDTMLSNECKLQEAIYEEITDRIDVCKANTEIVDAKKFGYNFRSTNEKSKQIRNAMLFKIANEEAEIAVCNAASENVPHSVGEICSKDYSKISTKIDLVLVKDNIIKYIFGDIKSDCYNNNTNIAHLIDLLSKNITGMDISYAA